MDIVRHRRPTRIDRLKAKVAGAPAGPRQPDLRRASLIAAAGELFVAKGVDATTVDDIAAQAGVAKGTFYHYFQTKADMLDALRTRFCDVFMDRVTAAVDECPPGGWDARLATWIRATLDAYFEMHGLHDVVFYGADRPVREVMGEIPPVLHLAELLAAGATAGAWTVDDPRSVALVMFHGLQGAADEAIVGARARADIAPMLVRLFARMVAR